MNPTVASYEPPTIPKDEACNYWRNGKKDLAHGVSGTAFAEHGLILIPLIVAKFPGCGDVGRFLDRLSCRCRIITVTSSKLAGMLRRRGWKESADKEYGDIWNREQ